MDPFRALKAGTKLPWILRVRSRLVTWTHPKVRKSPSDEDLTLFPCPTSCGISLVDCSRSLADLYCRKWNQIGLLFGT